MTTNLTKVVGDGTLWTTMSMWTVRLIGIGYSLVVISQLSLYQYGIAELIISIPVLISFLGLPGLDTVVTADMGVEKGRDNKQKVRDIFESYVMLRVVLAVLGWAVVFFGAAHIADYYNEDIRLMVQIVSFTFLTGVFRGVAQILFRTELKFRSLGVLQFAEELSKLLMVSLGFWLYGADSVVVVGAYVFSEVVSLLLFSWPIYKSFKHLNRDTFCSYNLFTAWKLLAAHGKWSVFGSYLNNFSQSIRLWLIKVCVGTEAVAVFSVALGLFQQTGSLMPLHKVIAPVIPQYIGHKSRFKKLVQKGIKYQTLSYVVIGFIGALFFPTVLGHLFSEYKPAFWLYQIILIGLLPSGFSAVVQSVFYAFKAQKDLFFAQIGITVITIVLLPLLLLNFGILGAAIEIVLTRILYAFERYRRVKELMSDFDLHIKHFICFDEMDKKILNRIYKRVKISRIPPA